MPGWRWRRTALPAARRGTRSPTATAAHLCPAHLAPRTTAQHSTYTQHAAAAHPLHTHTHTHTHTTTTTHLLQHRVQQLPAAQQLHDEVHPVLLHKVLAQLYDARVVQV